MTKAELVALITHQTGVEKTAAEAVVEAFTLDLHPRITDKIEKINL